MKKIISFLKRVDWVNTSFLLGTPLIAFSGTGYLAATGAIKWETVILAIVMAIFTGIAITGGYHRLFSHKSFDAKGPFKLFMLIFGAAAFENSALRWSSDHRRHHKFVDTPQDPYNIKQGFWHAHMGWVMMKYNQNHTYENVPDLEADPLVRFQHRYYVPLGIATGFALPTAIAALWGDMMGGFFIAGFLRTVMNHHFTFSINSFAHLIGRQPYSDKDSSRDSWFLALFTYGEGYHNYHHKFPADYRNGIRSYHWDPTKWLIKGLERSGQTYNLRQTPNETIVRARLKMDEKRLLQKMNARPHHVGAVTHEFVASTRVKIEDAYAQLRALKVEYVRLKEQKIHSVSERIEKLKADLHQAQARFESARSEWKRLCGSFGVRASRLSYS